MKITIQKQSSLEKEIEEVIIRLSVMDKSSDEYTTVVENLEKLYKAKSYDSSSQVSADTMALIAGNLLGLSLILGYERIGIITSKAINFVLRGRV